MDFRVLGPLEVAEGGHLLALGGPKQRTVLGLLLLQANEVVTVDGLVEGLWGSEPPPAARNALQSYVSRLRTLLGSDRIESRAAGYVLRADPDEVDLQRFEQLVSDARARVATDPREAVADLDRALQLWRGPPLADLPDSAAPAAEVARLDELRLLAVEDRVEARLATGLQADVVAELETLTRQHPLRERLWGQLMIALFRSGRQAEALQAYTRLRSVLADELGADPSPQLQQLHRRILVQDPALHPSERPRHNLPAAISTFVGRDEELREVAAFLADARLTTLVGAGGIGKTRLAVEAARDALGHFPDGVWLVDLAPLDDPASVLPAVGAALGVEERTGRSMREAVVEHVRPRRLLLVLDNCEHLVDETARTARTLLEVTPDVSMLATSRVALEMPGETVWRVPSMALPGTDGGAQTLQAIDTDAVQLFAQRARSARPDLTFGHDTTTIAVEICTRLDGIPLAIELAAARATTLPLPEIARGLEDRFRFLTRGARAALPRHRTLRAMVDWGYGLLTPGEQELFDHLSVFAGSFDLNAVAAVAEHGGTLDDLRARLDGLVAASMVIPHEAGADTPRYRLLETLRQYGADRLEERGESTRLRERHAGVYARRAQQAAAMLRTADPERWLDRVEVDLDNLRVAVDWSVIRAAADNALTLVPALCEFAVRRGRMTEWRAPVERALEVGSSGSPSVRAAALTAAGFLLYQLGEYERAEQVDDEAVRQCRATDDIQGLVEALNRRGHLAIFADGDFDTAAACFQESLALCDEHDYTEGRAWPLAFMAQVELFANTWDDDTRTRFEQAHRLFDEQHDRRGIAHVCTFLTVIALFEDDLAQAHAYATEAVTACQQARDPGYLSYSLFVLGLVARFASDLENAEELGRESLRMALELGERLHVGLALELLAGLAGDRQAWEQAARLWGTSDALRDDLGWPYPPFERALMIDRDREQVTTAIGQDRFDALVAEGRGVRPEEV